VASVFASRFGSVSTWWRDPRGPWSRRLALALPVTVTVSLLGVPAHAAPPVKAPKASTCPVSLPDEAAALISARLCGGNVAIDDATSQTTTAVATPSGQVQSTVYAAPVRVRQNGKWVPVDLTLVANADGTVSPLAAPSDLLISGAQTDSGSHSLVTAGTGSHRVAMGWTGKLPTPVLDGDKATYPDALPGVDLVVQATREGAETFLVVKTRAAAAQVDGVALPVTGASVASYRSDTSGNITLLDDNDKTLAASPAPTMWDARTTPGTGAPATPRTVKSKATKRSPKTAKPKTAGDGAGALVTLTPDQSFLTDPATQYPVTIDPQINPLSTTFDTYVKQNDTVDRSGANDLQLGLVSGNIARSFLSWDNTTLAGKQITAATINFWNWWSPSCTTASWEIWSTGAATSDTRWDTQPTWNTKEATSTATKGFSASCDDNWVAIDGVNFFQRAADSGKSRGYMGIRATSETDTNAFKQFYSRNAANSALVPFANVTYNSYPVIGALSTTPASACVSGANRPYINSVTPALKAVITDGESSPVKGVFEWYVQGGAKIGGVTTSAVASGSTVTTTVPAGAFTNGNNYSWRVQGNDGTVNGTWSNACEFTIDTTAPTTAPTASSPTYPQNSTGGAVGVDGTFTFGAAGVTDAAAFLYGLDTNPPTTAVNATTLGGSATTTITPTTAGAHTVYVRSRDRAGNLSPITSYAFTVGTLIGTMSSPKEGDLSAGKTVLTGTGATTSTGVTFQWRRGETDTWTTIPAGDVTTVSGGAAITWPVATTGSGNFPSLNWNVEQTVNNAEAGSDALDGPVQVRASYTGGTAGQSAPVVFALDRNRADAPTGDLGPGMVNLLTGNLTVGAVDASAAGGLGVSRAFNSRQAAVSDPLFGPGWVSSAQVSTAGIYRTLTVVGSLVQIGTPDGDTLDFTKDATTGTGATFAPSIGDETLRLEYITSGDKYLLTDGGGNVTTFTRITGAVAGLYNPTSAVAVGTGDTTAVSWEKVTVNAVDVVRPTKVVAPAPAGVTCSSSPLTVRGCQTLSYSYATSTTASGSTLGDYPAWNPATSAMTTVTLARYSYDTSGLLRAAWDPRFDWTDGSGAHQQATTYTYNTDGTLATITPPGLLPWTLAYTTVPGDAGTGRLATVSRSALSAGSAVTTVVYHVPVSGSGAPVDLSATQTVRWGQTSPPVDATAVFPPTQIPSGNQAAGTLPTNWLQATVTYLDGNARQVNTRQPGNLIDATWYEWNGDIEEELTARNRQAALDDSTTDTAAVEAVLAESESTHTLFSADGERVTDVYGPEHDVVLSDWNTVRGRTHTTYQYDQGAPTSDTPYNLVTTETETVQYWNSPGVSVDSDARTTTAGYDWNLRQLTVSTVDPQGLALASKVSYDSITGLVTATTTPRGDGTTAATRTTLYYRAGTGSGDSLCDSHPEWAGLPCRTATAAQPDSDPELAATYTTYDMFGQPTVVTDKNAGGTLRTTTIGYDSAGRAFTVAITANASLGTTVDTRRAVYDPATNLPIRSEQLNSGGTVTAQIVRGYDTLGRVQSYTDAAGNVSTTGYDIASRTNSLNDGKFTQTATYNDSTDGRGQASQIVDGQAGTFSGTYNADGSLATETRPDGLTVNHYYNEESAQTGIEYLRGSTTVYADYAGIQAHGQWQWRAGTLGNSDYLYDNASRLIAADQTIGAGGCTTRTYTFDKDSNRTGLTTYAPAGDLSCQTTTASSSRAWTYDTADRASTTGYTYDDLGRSLTTPAADLGSGGGNAATMSYYSNGMARTITQGTSVTTDTLDVMMNRFGAYSTTVGSTTVAHTNHYSGDSDSPAWIADSTWYARIITGLDGMAAQYTGSTGHLEWQIIDLHGDVVAMALAGATGLTATYAFDEYGNSASTAPRYGYLGDAQRSSDNSAGLITMGIRLYNPTTGRFLSTDPVYGGNANAYDYCSGDAANCTDISGAVSCVRDRYKTSKKWGVTYFYDWWFHCNLSHKEVVYLTGAAEGANLAGSVKAAVKARAAIRAALVAGARGAVAGVEGGPGGIAIGFLVALLASFVIDKLYSANCGKSDNGVRIDAYVRYTAFVGFNAWAVKFRCL